VNLLHKVEPVGNNAALLGFDAGGKVKASVPADPENIDDHSVHLPSV